MPGLTASRLCICAVGFMEVLATCHGLAQLGQELVGDPLDQRLFEATGAPGQQA
jgi:hypothetical protein